MKINFRSSFWTPLWVLLPVIAAYFVLGVILLSCGCVRQIR